MVDTMTLLRALMSSARLSRPVDRHPADGLPPDGAVLLDAPDQRLAPALVAAALGDHFPAAALLRATRESADWEGRDRYAGQLAAFARNRDEWLVRWQAAAPGDPDAALIAAELALRRAWASPARAERLREVGPLIDAAAVASPHDPVPWRLALEHARGTGAAPAAFEALWEQAVRRAPHHYGCHTAALRYLFAQHRHRSRPEGLDSCFDYCFDFAEQAAQDAGAGSLVRALPVRAAFARLRAAAGSGNATGAVPGARIDAAADLAAELSARHPAGDPWPAEVRNILAHVLVRRERWTDALEQFRLIGPYATSYPWSAAAGAWAAEGDDPLGRFLDARELARGAVAAEADPAARPGGRAAGRVAGWGGRSRAGGHYA
ncbi:hypothetical protein [Streptomyces lichenis]|uniref:DUF4034 domain-containing protein n=1 Tax=Streptomyces lichenis TaxID=2306967 RepID=A0ABT0IGL3_9ACTN|nr:hypothetical protein [Streptomyces lichenis]MCK8680470.1 hypothetical protein [Streptomyces lichenis]